MKLTQNIKTHPKLGGVGNNSREYSYKSKQQQPYFGTGSTANDNPNSVLNLNLNLNNLDSMSYKYQQGALSARNSNNIAKQMFPYDDNMIYSQVSEKINQFSSPSQNKNTHNYMNQKDIRLQSFDSKEIRDNQYNISYDDIDSTHQVRVASSNIISGNKKKIFTSHDIQYINQINQQLKLNILQHVQSMILQNKTQTSNSIRQAIIKVNQSIKKQCTLQFSKQFLPFSYMDDIQSKFQQTNKRLYHIQTSKQSSNKQISLNQINYLISSQKQQLQVVKINQESQQRCNENIRNQISFLRDSIKKLQFKLDTKIGKQNQQQQPNFKKKNQQFKINQLQFLNEISRLKQDLKSVKQDQDQAVQRLKKLQSGTNRSVQTLSNKIQQSKLNQNQNSLQMLRINRSLLQKPSIQRELSFNFATKIAKQSQMPVHNIYQSQNDQQIQKLKSMSFTYSMESFGDVLTNNGINIQQACQSPSKQSRRPLTKTSLISSISSVKDIKSSKYILDNQNNLMDDNGNYILDEKGQIINLNEEQIQILRQSNIVKYKQHVFSL